MQAYQVQDLKCMKCKQVKADYLQTYCSCSGCSSYPYFPDEP